MIKKVLFGIIAFLAVRCSAQVGPGYLFYVQTAPSGACSSSQGPQYVLGSGLLYTCQSGTWAQVGGGGSGTVTNVTFTGDGTVLSSTPSAAVTTSGTLQAALANAGAGTVLNNATGTSGAPAYTTAEVLGVNGGSAGSVTINGSSSSSSAITCSNANCGALNISTAVQATAFNYNSICAAVGSAASPSIVACGSSKVGAFSCATNASAATCTINTTGITANSVIIVTPVSDENTRLSVTCNTAPTSPPTIIVTTKTAATSFVIALPIFTTNPVCYDYVVYN